jgi:serine/threonine protein kinase
MVSTSTDEGADKVGDRRRDQRGLAKHPHHSSIVRIFPAPVPSTPEARTPRWHLASLARLVPRQVSILFLIPVMMLVFGGALIALNRMSLREENMQNWRDRVSDDSAIIASAAGRALGHAQPIISRLRLEMPEPDAARQATLLNDLCTDHPDVASIGIVAVDGETVNPVARQIYPDAKPADAVPPAPPLPANWNPDAIEGAERGIVKQALSDSHLHWTAPFLSADGHQTLACAGVIGSLDGKARVALVTFDDRGLGRLLTNVITHADDTKPFLFTASGTNLTNPGRPPDGVSLDAGRRAFDEVLANLPAVGQVKLFNHSNYGLPMLSAVRRVDIVPGPVLFASAVVPIRTLAASTTTLVLRSLWIEVGGVVIAAGLAGLLARLLTAQRRQIERAQTDARKAHERLEAMGSYTLLRLIGEGGMGEIWEAEHHLLARTAALKLITMDAFASNEEERAIARARFAREARATASLTSPHTVTIFDFGFTREGSFYYAMELLDGLDLDRLVRDHGAQPPGRVIRILIQVCLSLAEAHAAGMVHRDIKPANIYLCRLGVEVDVAKVLDFGLVADKSELKSPTDVVLGTPAFMAPEQAQGRPTDARSDLYAVGCVAFWLLAGRTPFVNGDTLAMLGSQVRDTPPLLTAVARQTLPEALVHLVARLLDKDPARRPQDATTVIQVLERIQAAGEEGWSREEAQAWWSIHHANRKKDGDVGPVSPTSARTATIQIVGREPLKV